jgi:hypothetical protein
MSIKVDFQPDPRLPAIPGALMKITNATRDSVTGEASLHLLMYVSEAQRQTEKDTLVSVEEYKVAQDDFAKRLFDFDAGIEARMVADPANETQIKIDRTKLLIEQKNFVETKNLLETALKDNTALPQFGTNVTIPADADVTDKDGNLIMAKMYPWLKTLDPFKGATDVL